MYKAIELQNRIKELKGKGFTTRQIINIFNKENIKPVSGGSWNIGTLNSYISRDLSTLRKLTEEQKKYILDNYLSKTYIEIAEDLGVNRERIAVFINRQGLKKYYKHDSDLYTKRGTLKDEISKIRNLLNQGLTISRLAERFNISQQTMSYFIKKNNLKPKNYIKGKGVLCK